MKEGLKQPLVSIIVITYNSGKYVLETLESAKAQTYQNIELIVSDDNSTDNTVEICLEWIKNNKDRFVRTELVTVEANTGIPANCNRGVQVVNGEWVKFIAGDDVLDKGCIEIFLNYAVVNKDIKILCSNSLSFIDEGFTRKMLKKYGRGKDIFFDKNTASLKQYELLLRSSSYIPTPTVFINRDIFNIVGLFDEEFRLLEDYPFWLRVTKSGFKIHFVNQISVYYRLHQNSVFQGKATSKLFNDFYLTKFRTDKKYLFPNISSLERTFIIIEFYRRQLINKLGLNRYNFFCRGINYITSRLSPIYYYKKLIVKQIKREIIKSN